ncbi:MAG TPA: hypothetical protein ENJ65_02865 [Candidatus Tenderia electrophaga]|uniref:Uncharacterized protein n=1 Tax=Candidatus Tenderia electrophaga TaxID=1748243 RepID=A0A832N6A5_9GAMM|nr:hypothetical protein [Candidatus Tenderia electrophaga]
MSKHQNPSEKQEKPLAPTEQTLFQFSQSRQAQFPKQALAGSATSATLICAFFMGAANALANDAAVLQATIAKLIDMDERGTKHLIDTTRRLAKKHSFIKDVIKLGQQTATTWQENDNHTLAQLLEQNQNQSLTEMLKGGAIKDASVPSTARASVNQAVEKNPRLKRLLLTLLLLIILVTANYLIFFLF